MEPILVVSAVLLGYFSYCAICDAIDDMRREGILAALRNHLLAPLCSLVGVGKKFRKDVYYAQLALVRQESDREGQRIRIR